MGSVEALLASLAGAGTVALDTSVFIYAFEDNPRFGAAAAAVFSRLAAGEFRACASVLALGEVLAGAYKAKRCDLAIRYRALFQSFPNLETHVMGADTAERTAALKVQYGLRTPNAIHLATALGRGARAFLTNDEGLRCVREVEVLLLSDHV